MTGGCGVGDGVAYKAQMYSQFPELQLRIHFLILILIRKSSKDSSMPLPWTTAHQMSIVWQNCGRCSDGHDGAYMWFSVTGGFIILVKEQRRNALEKRF